MEKRGGENGNLILNIWFAIKRSLFVVLAIIILSTACGLFLGLFKKPTYTAVEEVVFTAIDEKSDDIVTNHRLMEALRGTIVDFADEGVVVDRADFYYVTFIQMKNKPENGPDYSIDDFVYYIQNVEDPYIYDFKNKGHIVKANVFVSASVETDKAGEYAFSLGYTDGNEKDAVIKAKLYRLAFEREVQPELDKPGIKYFDGVTVNIIDLESSGVKSDGSITKYTVIGFVIGLVLAAIVVYIVNVSDTTVKSKDDLEQITGSTVIAYIEQVGGKK